MTRIRIRIGFGATIVRPTSATSPTTQSAGGSPRRCGRRRAGEIGARLKRLRKKPVKASATSSSESKYSPSAPDRRSTEAAEDRPRDRDLRLVPGVVGQLLQRDQRAEEGDEHRRGDRQPLPLGLEDVTQLVHEQEQDEADRELPAPEERIRADRDEHRAGDREELELEDRDEEELQLPDQQPDRGDRRPELAPDVAQRHRALDRGVGLRLFGLARRVRVVAHGLRVLTKPWLRRGPARRDRPPPGTGGRPVRLRVVGDHAPGIPRPLRPDALGASPRSPRPGACRRASMSRHDPSDGAAVTPLLRSSGGRHPAGVRATSRARMSASRSATAARCASVLAVRWARSAADLSASIPPVERGKPQLSMNITGLSIIATNSGYLIVLPDDAGVYPPGWAAPSMPLGICSQRPRARPVHQTVGVY